MKAIYLDCFSGISGDMLLGAFLEAGLPKEHLQSELAKLGLQDEFHLDIRKEAKCGLLAGRVEVQVKHEEAHHHHHHEAHAHGRSLADIRQLVEQSALSVEVKEKSLRMFENLAVAESKIHGVPKDDVHFHEVGATDSIVDMVGAAIALEALGITRVYVGRVNTGTGLVHCQHGEYPVPAPATAELLKDFSIYHDDEAHELTTPTGAAFLKTFATPVNHLPQGFKTETIAYGAGGRDLTRPNVLRMYVGNVHGEEDGLYKIETNIDDMTGELFGYVMERLFEKGALDVWATPILMKKSRPAYMLSLLVEGTKKEACLQVLFRETTSLGMRVFRLEERPEASRHGAVVETSHGQARCKVSAWQGQIVSLAPEYEDCRALALAAGVPLKQVYQEVLDSLRERLEG